MERVARLMRQAADGVRPERNQAEIRELLSSFQVLQYSFDGSERGGGGALARG